MKYSLTLMVTSYNQEKEIKEVLESLINQKTEYEYTILVSDDLSTDNTWLVLQEYEKRYKCIEIIQNKKKKYVGSNRNNLLRNVKTEYACFIDGDDEQKNDYVQKIMSSLNGKPIYHLKGFNEIWDDCIQTKNSKDYENVFLYVFSKEIIDTVEFCEDVKIGEDYIFSIKYYQLLNNNYDVIDLYYDLNRREDNISLTKNGDKKERYELELKLFNEIKTYEYSCKEVNGKINEKKIDLINFAILIGETPIINKVQTINIRNKHKVSYMMYRTLPKKIYKKILMKKIGYKI